MDLVKELLAYAERVVTVDPRDDRAFHLDFARGVELLGSADKDLAREFDVSRPTIVRWRNGNNAPHPAMRLPIFRELAKRARAQARRRQRAKPPRPSTGAATGTRKLADEIEVG